MVTISFSWDDGSPHDKRLCALFEKHGVPATLFVPTQNREGRDVLSAADIRAVQSPLISVGAHTAHHTYLTELPLGSVYDEVVDNKKYLSDILGKEVTDFCYPGGAYNAAIFNAIKTEFDTFRTAGTMCSRRQQVVLCPTFHFYPRGKKSLLLNAVRQRDRLLAQCLKTFGRTDDYFDVLRLLVDRAAESRQLFCIHIFGHSWEVEDLGLWQTLDGFLSFVCGSHKDSVRAYPEGKL